MAPFVLAGTKPRGSCKAALVMDTLTAAKSTLHISVLILIRPLLTLPSCQLASSAPDRFVIPEEKRKEKKKV